LLLREQVVGRYGRFGAGGGVSVVMSMLWGWWVDGHRPHRWDVGGASLCLIGVALIMFAPRHTAP